MRTPGPARSLIAAAVLAVALLDPLPALALTHAESTNGDLSDARLAPTLLALDPGANFVVGRMGRPDLDYAAVVVPSSHRLDALFLDAATVTGSVGFIAVQAGAKFTEPATGTDVANLLGWHHFAPGAAGTDILDNIGAGPGAIGFTGPLAAGTYTFWIQETGPGGTYAFDFRVAAVPEPGTFALLAAGLGVLASLRSGRRNAC